MTPIEIVRYQKRLDELFKKVGLLGDNAELQSHWARYLCVLISGFIEISVRSVYAAYAKDKAAPYVSNFVDRQLERLQNPNMDRILTIAGAFSQEWEAALREATEGELKDAVDSVVANRNRIAHGDDVGITYTRVRDYYNRVAEVIEMLGHQCTN